MADLVFPKRKVKYSKAHLAAFKQWGSAGGQKRAANMAPERRKEIAQLGVAARKAKRKPDTT